MRKINSMLPFLAIAGFVGLLSFGAATAQQTKEKVDTQQFARGAKAWAKTCARCHNMRSAQDNSDEEWHVDVTHMRVRANIPGDVARDIEAFLRASNK
jgi:cytochrome c1